MVVQSLLGINAIALLLFLQQTQAFAVFSASTDFSGVSSDCANALRMNLSCSSAAFSFDYNTHYPLSMLQLACTSSCEESITSWHNAVTKACDGAKNGNNSTGISSISYMTSQYMFLHQNACRKDGQAFCNKLESDNTTTSNATLTTRKVLTARQHIVPRNTSSGGTPQDCSRCILDKLHDVGSTDLYDGSYIRSQSVYQSYASSCGYSIEPLTAPTGSATGTTPAIAAASSTPGPKKCSGKVYTIKPGDDCHSISTSEGIATTWLLTDNDLPAYCANFPTTGTLCIENICDVYTVKKGDTCSSIAKAHGITEVQLRAWNPVINSGCFNLDKSIGAQVCVKEPGQEKYRAPNVTYSGFASTATTAAPVPSNIANETTHTCGRYHQAVPGEYCNLLTLKYGVGLRDFRFLNAAINENCTNLFAGESYCVQPVGDINTYPGRPGYLPTGITASKVPYASLPDATYVPALGSLQAPLARDTLAKCSGYALGSTLIFNQSFVSDCEMATVIHSVTPAQLAAWNPSLKDLDSPRCSFDAQSRYCVQGPLGSSSSVQLDVPRSTMFKHTVGKDTYGASSAASNGQALPSSGPMSNGSALVTIGGGTKTVVTTVVHLKTAVVYETVVASAGT